MKPLWVGLLDHVAINERAVLTLLFCVCAFFFFAQQLDTLTQHQRDMVEKINTKLENAGKEKAKLHVAGPAGSGKTFIVLNVCVEQFTVPVRQKKQKRGGRKKAAKPKMILFVARNEAVRVPSRSLTCVVQW